MTAGGTLLGIAGLALVAFLFNDFIRTTLRLRGSGPLSNLVMNAVWALARWLRRGAFRSAALSGAGMSALLATIATWAVFLWVGWLLVFLSVENAVVSSSTGDPATLAERVYFVGYSLATLGIGDFVPRGPFFQAATVAAALTGFFLMTLSITYMVPVVSAAVEARHVAARVLLLGDTPAELVANGGGRGVLADHASSLSGSFVLLARRLLAYPVLRYFVASERSSSIAVAIAVLDEALTLLMLGTDSAGAPGNEVLVIRNAIADYLRNSTARDEGGEAPPPPALESLRAAGLEPVPAELFARRLQEVAGRRRLLRALLESEDRSWQEINVPLQEIGKEQSAVPEKD